jgi:autotransporter-associated beta strand protein
MISASSVGRAQNLYWDTNGATAGAGGSAPAATWDLSAANWNGSSAGTGVPVVWGAGSNAVFAAGTDATGSYTVTVSGTPTAGGLRFEEGSVTLSGSGISLSGLATINVATGLKAVIASPLSGSAPTLNGSGELVLGAANTYAGNLTLQAGTLSVENNAAVSTGTIATANTANILLRSSGAGTVTLTNNVTLGTSGGFQVDIGAVTGSTLMLNGILGGSTDWRAVGPGTVVLGGSSANTFNALVTVTNGSILVLKKDYALGSVTKGTVVASGATLALAGGFSYSAFPSPEAISISGSGVGGLGALKNLSGNNSFDAAITLTADTTIGSDNDILSLYAIITGAYNLTKVGPGTVDFYGANAYGNTVVSAGTLGLPSPGTTGPGSVTVNAAARLEGNGSAPGNVFLSGTIMPAAVSPSSSSPGILTSGPQTWNQGASYDWLISDATGVAGNAFGWSALDITGGLTNLATSGNKFNLNLISLDPFALNTPGEANNWDSAAEYTWRIAKTTTGLTGYDPATFNIITADFQNQNDMGADGAFILDKSGADLNLRYVHKPTITVAPSSRTTNECSSTTFSVTATGSATLHYYWSHNGSPVGGDASSLTISDITPADAGTYSVIVSNYYNLTASALASLTVVDPLPVIVGLPANILTNTGPGNLNCSQVVSWVEPVALDNCPGVLLSSNIPSGSAFAVGTNLVTYIATDSNGQHTTNSFTVTVIDNTAPVVSVAPLTIQLDSGGSYTLTPANVASLVASATDACGLLSTNVYPNFFTCADVGVTNVTVVVADIHGNTTTNLAAVTVQDVTPPVVAVTPLTIQLDSGGSYTLTPANVASLLVSATDACGLLSTNVYPNVFSCADVGVTNVTVVVADIHGNATTNLAAITVEDKVAPVVSVAPLTIQLDSGGSYTLSAANVASLVVSATDACGLLSTNVSPVSFSCADVGVTNVEVVVADIHGNTTTNLAAVTVEDKVAPAVVVQGISVQLDMNGVYTLSAGDVASLVVSATDACGLLSTNVSPSSFTYCDVGNTNVTLTVTDIHGNVTTNHPAIAVLAPASAPTVVYVDSSYGVSCGPVTFPNVGGSGTYYLGYNAFNTIQAAIAAVASGGAVNVAPGTYNENLNVTNSVSLLSSGGRAVTTINLQTTGSIYSDTILISASSVSVKGFTVVGFNATTGIDDDLAGINFFLNPGVTNIEIANNLIQVGNISGNSNGDDGKGVLTTFNTDAPFADGISVHDNTFEPLSVNGESVVGARAFYINPTVGSFTFASNTITGNLYHSTTEANNSLIEGNLVIGTGTADSSGGFAIYGSYSPDNGNAIIRGNVITNTENAILLYDAGNVVIENNVLDANGTAIALYDADLAVDVSAIVIVNNSLANEVVAGVYNQAGNGSPNAATNWWGNLSGPSNPTLNPYGTGSAIDGNLTVSPWLAYGADTSPAIGFQPAPGANYIPTQLAFATQPGNSSLGVILPQQPVVEVQDINGTVTPWANPTVSVAFGSNPGLGLLAGTTNILASGGVATYNDLAVTLGGGSGFTLSASAPSLASATSATFNIGNPLPVLNTLNPAGAVTGSGGGTASVTVSGSSFVPNSQVLVNGSPVSTTFGSASTLTASLSTTTPGIYSVIISNPPAAGGVSVNTLNFTVGPTPSIVYVDGSYGPGNSGDYSWGFDAFATVQGGVDAVASGGTVNVAAGTYAENVSLNKSATLIGPNGNIDPNTGLRVAEAIILPATTQTSVQGSTSGTIIRVGSGSGHVDATIQGFTLDGHNASLTGGLTLNGVEIHTGAGIVNSIGSFDNNPNAFDTTMLVQNNIIKNLERYGVLVDNIPSRPGSAGNEVSHNKIDNLPSGNNFGGGRGRGIAFEENAYGTCAYNVITRVNVGWQDDNYNLASPGAGTLVANNTISTYHRGIFHNLQYQDATSAIIQSNTISVETTGDFPATTSNFGIELSSIQSAVGATVSDNIVSNNVYGVVLWNLPSTGAIVVSGGKVVGNQIGVWATSQDPQFGAAGTSQCVISNVTVLNATVAGVKVDDSTSTAATKLTVIGNSTVSGSPLGVHVHGAAASAVVLDNAASITGNGIGIAVDAGKALVQNNNLTNNTSAGISVTNGATVDAGNCTGGEVATGLGISTGGNDLSGYLTGPAKAIINGNTGGLPVVLGEHNNYGATSASDNIPGAFTGAVVYSQTPAVIAPPTNVTVVCVSDVPTGAADLAGFIAQGGYFSAGAAAVSFVDVTNLNGGNVGSGTITRTYTVADSCAVASLCIQTITVSDLIPPTIDALPNLTYSADAGQCSKSNVTWTVVAGDNCAVAGVASLPPSGSTFAKGTTTVTNIATDVSGNTATNFFTVTVNDTEAPTIVTCATNQTLIANVMAQAVIPDVTTQIVAADNCDSVTLSQIPAAGTVVGLGATPVTIWAADLSGNSNSCVATITVIDTTAPVLTVPVDVTVLTTQPKDPYATGTATATDANLPVTITYNDDRSGLTGCDTTGNIVRTWTAVDNAGNATNAVQIVTVVDDTNATYFTFVPAAITVTNDWGACGAVVNYAPTAMNLGWSQGFEDASWVSGVYSNNPSTDWNDYGSQIMRVASGTGGIVSKSGSAHGLIDSTAALLTDTTGAFGRLGGYSSVFGTGFRVAQDVYINLADPRVTTATTTNGYAWDLSAAANKQDGSGLRDFIFHAAAYDATGIVIAADNNSANSVSTHLDYRGNVNTVTLTNSGWYTFQWIFRDTNGVLAVDLSVSDTNGAVLFTQTLSSPSDLISTVVGGHRYLWFTFINADTLAMDNTIFERNVPVVPNIVSGTQFPVGTTTVTNSATDACGYGTNTTFTVTVNDVEPPVIQSLTDIVTTNDPGQCAATVTWAALTATDNCDVASVVATPSSNTSFNVGTNLVTVVATDIHGNTATNSFNVIVHDVEAPSAIVPGDIVQANDPNQCGAVVSFTLPSQADNCDVAGQVATPASGNTFPVGTTPVTLVVTDIHGNTATNTFNVTVNDTQPPSANVPGNIVQGVDVGQSYATVNFTLSGQTDNCAVLGQTATPPSGSQFPVGTNTVTVVVTDIHTNTATNTFTVAVIALPNIVTSPASRTNNAGTTATFSVVANSPAALSYYWKKDGTPLSDGLNISGATTATLTVASVSDTDVADYSVVVSNLAGTVSSGLAHLTVINPPALVSLLPARQTNNATSLATFTVSATGTLPFSYQWTKITPTATNVLTDGLTVSGSTIFGSTSNVLTITNLLAADQATYQVAISNPAGSVTTNGILVVIDPVVFVQPVSVTQVLGGNAAFAVTAVGTAPLHYQWQQNNVDLPGQTASNLVLNAIADSAAGNYRVIVTNLVGLTISSNATLVITHPPVFTLQPVSLVVTQGSSPQFSVNVNGTSPFAYQWRKGGNPLSNGGNISGVTTRFLNLASVTAADDGVYSVLVTNVDGSAISSNASLTVIVPPAITSQPHSLTNNAGTVASFAVTNTGSPSVYRWYKNGITLLSDGLAISGSATPVLTISNVFGADSAFYTVTISNAANLVASSPATLTVIDPIITNQPVSLTNNAGTTATFAVGFIGTAPGFQWFTNGLPLSGATSASLVLNNVSQTNAVNYTVVLSNAFGVVTSSIASLTVIDPPVIITPPASLTVNATSNATFTVGYTGTAPSFQWFTNGAPLSGANSATLTLVNVSQANAVDYTVVLANAAGSVTSSPPAHLTVIDGPVITNQPASLTVNATSNATFTVGYAGTAPSFQWFTNGAPLSGANSSTLTLLNVSQANAVDYTVVLSNPAGSVTSSPAAHLTVIDGPVITNQPASLTVNATSNATFTVGYTGTAPSLQWFTNGLPLSGATSATLTLVNVSQANAVDYTVVLANAAGSVTSSPPAHLTVIDGPVITSQPSSRTNNAGTTAIFTVTNSGSASVYQWYKNGLNLSDVGNVSGATTAVLTLTNVLGADGADYSVTISNAAGMVTSSLATLTVVDPFIMAQPVGVTNIAGSTVNFAVTAVGTAPLAYQWYQDGNPLYGETDSELTLTDIAGGDAGLYTVVITNVYGARTSSPAILVTIPPLIVSQPVSLIRLVGESAAFSVDVNGATPFSYQWSKNDTDLLSATNRILSLASVQLSDSGSYRVHVTNPLGEQFSDYATLSVYTTTVPVLTIVYSNDVASVGLIGVPTYRYAIQGSTNLSNWTPVQTNASPFTLTETNVIPFANRFYRGIYLP